MRLLTSPFHWHVINDLSLWLSPAVES
jgi:hypothetical protein